MSAEERVDQLRLELREALLNAAARAEDSGLDIPLVEHEMLAASVAYSVRQGGLKPTTVKKYLGYYVQYAHAAITALEGVLSAALLPGGDA